MKRRIIWRIVLCLVLLLAALVCVDKVLLPLFDTSDDLRTYVPDIKRFAGTEDTFTLENDTLAFALDPETTHFTITDKRTGKVWSSTHEDVAKDAATMLNEKERLQSVLTLDYKNNTGKQTTFNTYARSVTNKLYALDKTESEIHVTYTIGDIARTYMYPDAISADRLQPFLDQLAKKDQRTITDAYKKYDPAKYGKKDDVATLEATYPDLKDGKVVYVLRKTKADTKENAATKIEKAFSAAGYTADDLTLDESRIVREGVVEGATDKPIFNVTVVYRLEGDDLVVEVPLDKLSYNPDYPITTLDILPAFGAAGKAETGYILVPEGTGAIINYNNGKVTQNAYYANMYGWDWASIRKEIVSETRMIFPVFGMATGGSSFLCIIEDGVSWAGINADVAGRNGYGSFNSANAEYAIVHGDSYDVSERTNNTVYMFEQQLPEGKLSQRYRFVASEDYMDMASAYREYLLAKHPELNREVSSEAHTVIEMVGAIDKVQQVFGIPTNVPIPMTDYKQAKALLEKLISEKLPNLSVRYTGWMNGGMTSTILNKVRLMKEMGKESDLKAFIQAAKDAGIPLYLDGLTSFAYQSGIQEGFIAMRDAAQFTTREEVELYEYSTIWYGQEESLDTYYLLKPALAMKAVDLLAEAAEKYGAAGVAFRDLGNILSADYNAKDLVTREEVRHQQMDALHALKADGLTVMTRSGNDYSAVLSDIVTDIDFDGLQYRIFDEMVPFYTAALHGSVVYTGPAINLADDREELLLRSAESGASLQYTLMAENVEELQDSWFSEYYGADVSIIYDDMIAAIKAYNEALSGTFNQEMVDHDRIGSVTMTEYANGVKVYVNFGYTDAEVDGMTIPARSYLTAKEAIE